MDTTPELALFDAARPAPVAAEYAHFALEEDASPSYQPRTLTNAEADATWAYAVDFDTAGERLTAAAAGAKLLQVRVGTPAAECARLLVEHLARLDAKSLNVAGNGLATLARQFPNTKLNPATLQAKLDAYVLAVLREVHAARPLKQVRSGGQSGVDEAGAKAAIALGIPTRVLMPKGFRFRNALGEDRTMTRAAAWRRFVPRRDDPDGPF
jgi:hypothetical protein